MDVEKYRAIISHLNLCPISAIPHFTYLAKIFSTSRDTIYSIYSQEIQTKVIKFNSSLRAIAPQLARQYLQGHDFLSLCYAPDLPPCIVIRRILESIPALSLRNPKRITELLRHPDKIRNLISIEKVQEALQQEGCPFALQDATAFLDKLTEDIYTAVQCDLIYSPTADVERHKAGLEHEAKLYSALESMDISYLSEDLLRSKGFYKTPDARLQVPIAVSGKVVCWVDSKATFGDERTHRQQFIDQYSKYINRFGPGMVVYWHGYISHLQNHDRDVLVVDDFPSQDDILMLPQVPVNEFCSLVVCT